MWWTLGFLFMFIVFCALYAIEHVNMTTRAKSSSKVSGIISKAISSPNKTLPIDRGSVFSVPGECYVLGSFFDRDIKFCTFCHLVDKRLVSYPGVAEISDENKIIFKSENITKEVKNKSYKIYSEFKKKNQGKFLEEDIDEL